MLTKYSILIPGQPPKTYEIEMPEEPGLDEIKAVVQPVLGEGNYLEHVWVVREDNIVCSMFVDETGQMKGLPRNEEATTNYRRNWLSQHPSCDPEDIPWIAGPAVLFERRVWF